MIRLSKIILFFTAVVLLAWLLPWTYRFLTVRPDRTPFTLYSCVTESFASIDFNDGEIVRHDASGKTYTDREFDSILPLFYYRQLLSDGRQPDTLRGVALTPQTVSMQSFYFRNSPSDINKVKPELYPLLEAMSGRVELQMPPDVFRIHDRIEFIDMASNSVNAEKSLLFTEAMTKKNFRFPAIEIAGNPTVKKEYDEGYLLLDADRRLFHLKQVKGRPYVRAITLPEGLTLEHLYLTEFRNKKTLAFMTDANNAFYVLQNRTYEIVKTGIPAFDPETDALTIIGNMFDWTVRVTTPASDNYYALDANDYSLIKKLENESNVHSMPGITFTSYTDKYVMPRFE